jgi:hypothetical protein
MAKAVQCEQVSEARHADYKNSLEARLGGGKLI